MKNHLEVWRNQIWAGECPVQASLVSELTGSDSAAYLHCGITRRRVSTSEAIGIRRDLGVMTFSMGLS